MTVEQFIAGLDELVDAERKRFEKEKVAIYGHSWGSALGALYAARFPDKVSAYVGAGQVADAPGRHGARYVVVEDVAGQSQGARMLGFRFAEYSARHAILHLNNVG